ncbi:DUF6514 family protein [Clostridium sp.]|uniref:DUF6514 family protein n=1 Tax=Clostridium sp. TaxID=1506 RepID=UPI002608E419|nr:DUF6514 family protein [Clostridium sp.]
MRVVKNLCKELNEGDKKLNFSYRLIENNYKGREVYGIEIEREDFVHNILTNIERDSVEKISPNKEKVFELVQKLYDFQVSPIHLIDIIGEDIDNYVADFTW